MNDNYETYEYLIELLYEGNIELLEEAKKVINNFPSGVDDFIQRNWITNAIDCGHIKSVMWVLSNNVDLSFRDDEGYTPLLSAIERSLPDKHEILKMLIDHGAPINRKGINDWTPLHMAAVREDIDSLEILVANGADLSIKTDIDLYATPLEEATYLKCLKSVEYLKKIV